MIWQDIVFAIGNIIFIIALIPSIKSRHKPSFYTSFPSSIILLTFSFTLASLELWASAIVTLIVAALWIILAIQKYKSK